MKERSFKNWYSQLRCHKWASVVRIKAHTLDCNIKPLYHHTELT